jgi:hypothetical protein
VSQKVRIGGAVALGTLIILASFHVSKQTTADQRAFVIAAAPREVIETTDLNSDGTPDWEEHLAERVFKSIELPVSAGIASDDPSYTPPTTLTGKFSEAFLQDYLQGKMDGQDFSDPTAFVDTAIQAIERNAESKRYSISEIYTIPTTPESAHAYGNTLQAIVSQHSSAEVTENEMVILQRALEVQDPELLQPLKSIADGYERIIADTVSMPVPDAFIVEHIAILNAYEAVYTDIRAAELAFTDPLYTLARVRDYETHAKALLNAYITLAKALTREGVVYTSSEPGAFYRLLETL